MAIWLDAPEYWRIRQRVTQDPEGRELVEWAENVRRPADPEEMALNLASVIITSNLRYNGPGKAVLARITEALRNGRSITPVEFNNTSKVNAIKQIWRGRHELFARMRSIQSLEQAEAWCEGIPYIQGPALRYQAIRDCALADVLKPDRHLLRIAESNGESLEEMGERLSRLTGESKGVIDMVLWCAASEGLIQREEAPMGCAASGAPAIRKHVLALTADELQSLKELLLEEAQKRVNNDGREGSFDRSPLRSIYNKLLEIHRK
jgi:hypothetical protein